MVEGLIITLSSIHMSSHGHTGGVFLVGFLMPRSPCGFSVSSHMIQIRIRLIDGTFKQAN